MTIRIFGATDQEVLLDRENKDSRPVASGLPAFQRRERGLKATPVGQKINVFRAFMSAVMADLKYFVWDSVGTKCP
jgi:hypothetical protein